MQVRERTLPKVRQQVGKYRIERKLAEGGFAAVYRAFDTIEGRSVALKVPYPKQLSKEAAHDVKREVRLTTRLEHRNICPIKNAEEVDGLFLIASPLGVETLADRLERRLSPATALIFAEQLLEAVAFAHSQRLIHCDIKPENIILFPGPVLKLTDFGIAKVALRTRTLYASNAGTIGYLAPEQALGRPSARSDVFSVGLVLYRMFAGSLPAWPYDWPPENYDRLRRTFSPALIEILRRAIQVDHRKRFRDGEQMLAAFRRVKARALREPPAERKKVTRRPAQPSWRTHRFREFHRRFGKVLAARSTCRACEGPVSEEMSHCPWCGKERRVHRDATDFPKRCRQCGRGRKADWRYCGFCYVSRPFETSGRRYGDKRYISKCGNPDCRGELMRFQRYCPWCRTKVRRPWKLPETKGMKEGRCPDCRWGVLPDFWDFCPWCGKARTRRR